MDVIAFGSLYGHCFHGRRNKEQEEKQYGTAGFKRDLIETLRTIEFDKLNLDRLRFMQAV